MVELESQAGQVTTGTLPTTLCLTHPGQGNNAGNSTGNSASDGRLFLHEAAPETARLTE